MYFSLDSVPDEQLTPDGALMDDSNKNFPEPTHLKRFRLVEGESVLPTRPPNSIASLTMRAQRRRAQCFSSQLLIKPKYVAYAVHFRSAVRVLPAP